ncbi:MAG: hypothetical protein ACTH5M_06210 [Psychrobacter sp.]|uniref:hypothetical protein n=1 Tax=Psychrobacter sp. AOP7-B1-24 TaxID=3457645 RepID=UPI003FB7FD02
MLELFFWGFMLLLQIVFGLLMFYGVFKVMIWRSHSTRSKRGSDSAGGDFDNSHSSGTGSTDFCGGDGGGGGCD